MFILQIIILNKAVLNFNQQNFYWKLMNLFYFQRILKDKEDLPAGRVKPDAGSVYWIVDEAAAAQL